MDSEFLGIFLLIALILVGAPMWLAFGIGGVTALVIGFDIDPELIVSMMYNRVHTVTLLAIPLFMLCGECLGRGGAAAPLVRFLNAMMGHIPGGPAYVVIISCMIFAAMASGGLAFLAGFAPIILPMMIEMGYTKKFSLGLMIVAASLGTLVPPSIPLIIYGFVTETSVKDLYTAAFVPAAILGSLLALTVLIHSKRGHFKQGPRSNWKERWGAFKQAWPVLLMPPLILIPIYGGMATATETASIAAVYSIFLGTVVYRKLNLRQFWDACTRTAHLSGMILAIIMTAFLVNQTLVYMRVPFELGDAITDANLHWMLFISVIIVAYLAMGLFLEPNVMLIVTPPILLPALLTTGYDPIAFGVVTVLCVELAIITPPYGIGLFVASGVLNEDFDVLAKACLMFYPALIIGLFLVALVPDIILWL